LFDDYRLSTINKLPTWAKKQVSSSWVRDRSYACVPLLTFSHKSFQVITNVDMEVSVITESVQNTSILSTRAKPEGRWAEVSSTEMPFVVMQSSGHQLPRSCHLFRENWSICIWKYFILFSVLIHCKSFPIHLVKMTKPLLVRGHYNINCFLIYTWWY
jgi:hypothetical protein